VAAAAAATLGSGGVALLRWLTGQWLPSWQQLVNNRYIAAYLLTSAAVGAAATYLYDDMRNPKVNTLIKVRLVWVRLAFWRSGAVPHHTHEGTTPLISRAKLSYA
jgi:hypothetical protein